MRQPREDEGLPGAPAVGVTIRRETLADVPAVTELRARSWRAAYAGVVPDDYLDSIEATTATIAQAEARFRELSSRVHALVADLDGAIIGFAYAGPDRDVGPAAGEIWAIYVDPEHWGAGIGRALLAAAVDMLAGGDGPITLWVLEDNVAARGFYEHFGFRPTGARRQINLGRALPEVQYLLSVDRVSSLRAVNATDRT